MMKQIRLMGVMLWFTVFCSCDNLLEVTPENSVTFENAIMNEKDVESMVSSIRTAFRRNVSFWANEEIILKGVIGDKFDEITQGAKELSTGMMNHNTHNSSMNWRKYYDVIASTNVVIDNAKNAENVSQERLDFYKGQAYFYRAYVYFMIAQTWGDAPVVKNGRDVEEKAKSTWEEVVQQVLDDAQKAIDMLPTRDALYNYAGNRLDRNDMPNREAAYMLKAQALAWKASLNRDIYGKDEPKLYEEAIACATEVIKSPNFELAGSSEEVCTKVLVGDSREGIFEVRNDWDAYSFDGFTTARRCVTWPVRRDRDTGDINTENQWDLRVKIKYETASKLFGKDDLRRDAYFYRLDWMGTKVRPSLTGGFAYPYKFRKAVVVPSGYYMGQFMNFDQNHVIFRLADIILLRAECYARLNKTTEAIADLLRIRNRAYGKTMTYPLVEVDKGDLRLDIFKERERELLWEDQRYFDIVRNGYYRTEVGSSEYKNLSDQDVRDGALYLPNTESDNRLMRQNRYWLRRGVTY